MLSPTTITDLVTPFVSMMRCRLLNGPNWSPPAPPSTRREALSSSKTNSRKPAASTPNFNSKKADPAHHPNTPSTSDITPPQYSPLRHHTHLRGLHLHRAGSARAETSGVERRQCFRYSRSMQHNPDVALHSAHRTRGRAGRKFGGPPLTARPSTLTPGLTAHQVGRLTLTW